LILALVGISAFLIWGGVSGLFTPSSASHSWPFAPACWAAIPNTNAMYLCNPTTNSLDLWRYNGASWNNQWYSIANTTQCAHSLLFTNGTVLWSGSNCTANLTAYVLAADLTVTSSFSSNDTATNGFWAGVANGPLSVVSVCETGTGCQLELGPTVVPSSPLTVPWTSLAMNPQWLFGLGLLTNGSSFIQHWSIDSNGFTSSGTQAFSATPYNYVAITNQNATYYGGSGGFWSKFIPSNTGLNITSSISTVCQFVATDAILYFANTTAIVAATAGSPFTVLWAVSITGAPLAGGCELLMLNNMYLVLLSTDRSTVYTVAI
jgi:hypothetical protein